MVFVLTVPAMDGHAFVHLSAIDGSSQQDFGVERMYGAVWWGGGSLIAGIGIDYFGFEFLYALAIVLGIFVYVAVGLYLWGVNRVARHSMDCHWYSSSLPLQLDLAW